jgi:hypothetical protein
MLCLGVAGSPAIGGFASDVLFGGPTLSLVAFTVPFVRDAGSGIVVITSVVVDSMHGAPQDRFVVDLCQGPTPSGRSSFRKSSWALAKAPIAMALTSLRAQPDATKALAQAPVLGPAPSAVSSSKTASQVRLSQFWNT